MIVNIIKGGIRNSVDERQFEKLYKPNGWRIDDFTENKEDAITETIKLLNTETEVKNYIKMTKKERKKFDDKLFFSEATNEKKEGD